MSWDVILVDLPPTITSLDQLPKGIDPPPLGVREEVIARICARIPEVDFSDPSWGRLDHPSFSIELNLGDDAQSLMLHIRGGDEALGAVQAIASAIGHRAFDCSSGDAIDFNSPEAKASFAAWREFRDRVVSNAG